MNMMISNLFDAAEACFESDPSPNIEKWTENLYNKLYNSRLKKVAGTTHVQHQKRDKRKQKEAK